MNDRTRKLTLHQPVTYQIKIPGEIDLTRGDWAGRMHITVEDSNAGYPITTLTGDLDQAGLHGLLQQIYSMGLPLISVNWIRGSRSSNPDVVSRTPPA